MTPDKPGPAAPLLLSLGSGGLRFPGWVHVDYDPQWQPDLRADLRALLPFADASVGAIHSEDFLGQLDVAQASRFFSECHRVLQPGGLLRLLTPDLRQLAELYLQGDPHLAELWHQEVGLPLVTDSYGELFNTAMRFSGQQCLYDEPLIRALAEPVGLKVERCSYRQGRDAKVAALDVRRPDNAISMYLECWRADHGKADL